MPVKGCGKKGLTAYQLKWIALITMTLDHFGKMFCGYWILPLAETIQVSENVSRWMIEAAISAGYLTIYIFLWLIAEGCRHTHAISKYIGRLLLFGGLAEIPFQLMVRIILGEPLSLRIGLTNVMFTFALGALACEGYHIQTEKNRPLCSFLIPLLCGLLAHLLGTDYGAFGVFSIFLFYLVEDPKQRLKVLTLLIVSFIGIYEPAVEILHYGFELIYLPDYLLRLAYALLAVPLLAAYHGERGPYKKHAKYLFYVYYPVHIAVLVLLFIGIMSA